MMPLSTGKGSQEEDTSGREGRKGKVQFKHVELEISLQQPSGGAQMAARLTEFQISKIMWPIHSFKKYRSRK